MIGAAILAAAAVGFGIAAVLNQRRGNWLSGAETVDLPTAASRPGSLVRVDGVVQAGPSGPVQGPMSQQPAAWWATKVEEEWREQSGGSQGSGGTRRRRRTLEENQSTVPFALMDAAGTTTVLVDGSEVDVDKPVQSVHKRDHGSLLGGIGLGSGGGGGVSLNIGRGGSSYIQQEWILNPGTAVEAVGTVLQDPNGAAHLVNGEQGKLVVTTRSIDKLVSRSRTFAIVFGIVTVVALVAAVVVAVIA